MRSARKVNDEMGNWVVENFKKFAIENSIDPSSTEITLMGYTFKENCSDTRNTKVHEIAISLRDAGFKLMIWDPYIDHQTIKLIKKDKIFSTKERPHNIKLAFICVYHKEVLEFLEFYNGLVYDFRKLNKIS